MRLTLVRHGESTWNAAGTWQGQSDAPLSPRGQLQARALAGRMYETHFDVHVCSDLARARDTAAPLGLPMRPDARWREIDVGRWAGVPRVDVAARFPEELAALRRGDPVRIGGGESMREFEARVDAALLALAAEDAEEALVVTHGGVIRALATRALGLRGRESPLVGVSNTSLTGLEIRDGAITLLRYNDAVHLDPADRDGSGSRAVVVGCEFEPTERRVVDGLLAGLGIALYYASPAVLDSPLAEQLVADPLNDDDGVLALAHLQHAHPDEAFAVLLSPAEAGRAVGAALDLPCPDGLGPLAHAAVAQIRRREEGPLLHSWNVPLGV
ncbi:MAG: histidine phosphatase family protein [Sandaracinaceae bacterium]